VKVEPELKPPRVIVAGNSTGHASGCPVDEHLAAPETKAQDCATDVISHSWQEHEIGFVARNLAIEVIDQVLGDPERERSPLSDAQIAEFPLRRRMVQEGPWARSQRSETIHDSLAFRPLCSCQEQFRQQDDPWIIA
jgi:hypothetical protein